MNYWAGDGQIPPKWAREKGLKRFWRKSYCSDITQPPILAYAAQQVFKNSKDKTAALKFLKLIFPKLLNYQRFFFQRYLA